MRSRAPLKLAIQPMQMMPDWDQLRIFYAIAEAQSLTGACDHLHISQSALSRRLSLLEQQLGTTLFHRSGRGLKLTAQGELLHRAATDITRIIDTAQTDLENFHKSPIGLLRVSATIGLGSVWLAPRIATFHKRYRHLQIELLMEDHDRDVANRESDMAILLHPTTNPGLIQRRLFTVHFHTYAAQAYLDNYGTPETLADLDNHTILSYGDSAPHYLRSINRLETIGRSKHQHRVPLLRANNVIALSNAVACGSGIAILPDYVVRPDADLTRILPDIAPPTFETYCVYSEDMRNARNLQVFRDYILAEAREWKY